MLLQQYRPAIADCTVYHAQLKGHGPDSLLSTCAQLLVTTINQSHESNLMH